MSTVVFIHVAVLGEVNKILGRLISRIERSSLKDHVQEINLVVNGDLSSLSLQLNDSKWRIVQGDGDASRQEFSTLDLLWERAMKEDLNLLYLHTKGASNPKSTTEDWVEYLTFFSVEKWRDRLEELKDWDCTGVNLGGDWNEVYDRPDLWETPPHYDRLFGLKHYSGNFWWTKSSHVRRLPKPSLWVPGGDWRRWRIAAEMWVCGVREGDYLEVWNSRVNHYLSPYPRERYASKGEGVVDRPKGSGGHQVSINPTRL